MGLDFLNWIAEHPLKADQSALGAIHRPLLYVVPLASFVHEPW